MLAHTTRALLIALPLAGSTLAVAASPARSVQLKGDVPQSFALSVGKPAPALQVGQWLRGEALTAFEPGTTYVVEFWATWHGPCLQAIPHLSQLNARYSQGAQADGPRVRFIGVSIWEDEPQAVAPFVERMGDQISYAIATDLVSEADPDGETESASAKAWMDAAGQAQLPTVFVVDSEGRVAWIGHPLELERPLAKIASGNWDLTRAAAEHSRHMALVLARRRLGLQLAELARSGKWDEAVGVVEASLVDHPNLELELGVHKYELLAQGGKREECRAYGERLVDVVFRNEPGQLGALAWSIVEPGKDSAQPDLALARRAAQRANELTRWSEASLIDTLALVVFEQGETEKAIQLQEKAVELAQGTPFEEQLTRRLDRFRSN